MDDFNLEENITKILYAESNDFPTLASLAGMNILTDFSYEDLSEVLLNDADLKNGDFKCTNFINANLSGADLSYANLSKANLSGADLSYANLSKANLSGADLSYANLSNSNLSGADLSYVNLKESILSNCDLSDTKLIQTDLVCATCLNVIINHGTKLHGANIEGTCLEPKIPKHEKKYKNIVRETYNLDQALEYVLKSKFSKFDETVDIAVRLGVDPRKVDQMVRSSVILPNGTGKTARVLVFAKGEKEKEALAAGADFAGSDEIIEKIKGGWLDFDKTIATPDMMGEVGKIGRILGPRNLMPNAKLGTVTFDITRVVEEIKKGKVDFRVDKAGVVHATMGKSSFGAEKLIENIVAFIDKLIQIKPRSSKGVYLRKISMSTTLGPSVNISSDDVRFALQTRSISHR